MNNEYSFFKSTLIYYNKIDLLLSSKSHISKNTETKDSTCKCSTPLLATQ